MAGPVPAIRRGTCAGIDGRDEPTAVRLKRLVQNSYLDSTPSDRDDANRDRSQTRQMRHRNTILYSILNYLPWQAFDRLVLRCESDKHVRTLSTKTQFIALAYGQLAGASGLRETVTTLNSHDAQLHHLGGRPIARSTLSDANANRPSTIFQELFAIVMTRAHRGLRQELKQVVRLIDSTPLRLNQHSKDWARFSADVCGAKVHVIYDPDANQPVYAAFSKANVNDITAAQVMPIEPGATYVFDLGYYDYAWWGLCLVGEDACRGLPHCHPPEDQHQTHPDTGTADADGPRDPVRSHRAFAEAPGAEPT
jgi:Domain of unknown function (DUF4372)/Transposase DDE domain